MSNSLRLIVILLLAGLPVVAESSEYQLFSPTTLEGEPLLPERGKGVLVRRITIKPGDTLSRISRKFSGRGSWFSQILLFNDIKNPDLIIAGKELLVPVSKLDKAAKPAATEKVIPAPVAKEPAERVKPAAKARTAAPPSEKASRKGPGKTVQKKELPPSQQNSKAEQESYSAAINAYRKGEYQKALASFGRFLELYPSSALAPDASFYKAECLLKLSDQ